jgi:hypothetical protein
MTMPLPHPVGPVIGSVQSAPSQGGKRHLSVHQFPKVSMPEEGAGAAEGAAESAAGAEELLLLLALA